MSGGHGAHVDNGIWMRAVMMGGMLLTIGVLLFATPVSYTHLTLPTKA